MKTFDHGFENSKGKIKRKGNNSNLKKVQRYIASLNNEQISRMMDNSGKSHLAKGKDVTGESIYKKTKNAASVIQPKLEISQPADRSEQQADKVAEGVTKGDTNLSKIALEQPVADISTKSEDGTMSTTPEFDQQLQGTKGQGQKLGGDVRSEMENHLDTDLSGVNVHTSGPAKEMSEGINAKAFTHGQDVYFNEGQYNPASVEGKSLLAHELTHTVQQGDGLGRKIQRFEGIEHKKMGDEGSGKQLITLSPFFKVTLGDLTALAGDYFESVSQIKEIAKVPGKNNSQVGSVDEINYILDYHINGQDNDPKAKAKYSEAVREAADKRATNLLPYNTSHFSNSRIGDEKLTFNQKSNLKYAGNHILNNETGYHQNHDKALTLAFNAGKLATKGGDINDAWIYEGFASHFLTDAFSSGHVRTPRNSIADYWKAKIPMFGENIKGWLLEYLVKGTEGLPVTGNIKYGVILSNVEDKLADFSFGDLIGGVLHDYDNEHGLEVMISGKPTVLYGDSQIIDKNGQKTSKGLSTFNAATAAVKQSTNEVKKAFELGKANVQLKESDMRKQLQNKEGFYAAETVWPTPIQNQKDPKRQQLKWQVDSFSELVKDPTILEALRKYCDGKIAKNIEDIKKDLTGASKLIATPGLNIILKKFHGTADIIKKTLQEIIDYTPGAIADTSGWFGAAGDDRAVEYYEKAKKANGLSTLTLVQRARLLKDGLSGPTVGSDDKMISDVITSTPKGSIHALFVSLNSDGQTGWDWVYSDLSGDDLKKVISSAGQAYWKEASFNEKWKECYSLIGWSGVNLGMSPSGMAQLVIMTMLRSDQANDNKRLDVDFQFKKIMSDNYEKEIDSLVGPQ